MWETIKNALMGVKEATGIEIPGLPADLGSLGESATTALQSVTESATGVVEGAATATEAFTGVEGVTEAAATATESVTGNLGGVTDAANTAVDSVSQSLPDLPGLSTGGR
ncbi:MAG TPA: hypothetical protein VF391_13350 [Dermatophilaceae bacterium]|jgi:hypothetical protein